MTVHTKLHEVQALGYALDLDFDAHYVIQADALDAVRENGHRLAKAAKELAEAGLLRMPFPRVLVEADFSIGASNSVLTVRGSRMLVHLTWENALAGVRAVLVGFGLVNGTPTAFAEKPVLLTDFGVVCDNRVAVPNACAAAFLFAALMANTRGIEKELVTHDELNAARRKRGRVTIQPYTVVRIGSVYDRTGRAATGHRRGMPVHWRAGHWRQQSHGPARTMRKHIYIEPVLVNFDPDAALPPVRPKHVKV